MNKQVSEGRSERMQEIDYTLEGESADRFRKNFGNDDWLKVPRIYWERTTQEILTMEYCPGVKINRIAELDKLGVDRKRLAKLAVESYLQQILTYGFFHAGMALLQ
jgi:predicted unusual protein kinase regulating ubiquinone biosynthesis (AarF/ABC1/UbiB family)